MAGFDINLEIDIAAAAAAAAKAQGQDIGPADQQEPSFFQRIGSDLAKRGDQFQEITAAPPKTNLESLGKGVQVLGTGAGAILDVMGETVSQGVSFFNQALSFITPDVIEDPIVRATGNALEAIIGTDTAKSGMEAASKGVVAYQGWAKENPEAAKTVAALGNIALLAAPAKAKPKMTLPLKPRTPARAGDALKAAADAQPAAKRSDFVADLVRPKPTKKVREAEILRTTESGILGGRKVTPSASEQSIAKTVAEVGGVKPKNTTLQNLGEIQSAIKSEAETLASGLKASNARIPRQDIRGSMIDVGIRLSDEKLLVGDAAKIGKRVIKKSVDLMKNNPNTPAGVFKARLEFDNWVSKQKPKIFDPSTESAMSIATRETRQAMNEIVVKSAPEIAVRKSLDKQSNLFSAVENIGPKAADEASTAIARLGQSVAKTLGIKSGAVNLPQLAAAGATTAAVAGSAVVAPQILAGALAVSAAGMGAKNLVMSATSKRAVAALLRQSENALALAKKSGDMELVRKLRVDRAAVVEIMRSIQTEGQ